MMSLSKLVLSAIICVAALSFAAGRVVTTARPSPAHETLPIPLQSESVDKPARSVLVPTDVPDLIRLPFVETYRILKGASRETIASYSEQLQRLPAGPARDAAISAFFKTLIQVHPQMARDLILELKKDDRWLPLTAIRTAAMPRGMEAVAEVLLSFDRAEISGCSYDLLRDSLDEWGRNDPLALRDFFEKRRGQDLEGYFDKLILNWAAYDPHAAQEWIAAEIQKRPVTPEPPDGVSESAEDSSWRSSVEEMSKAWIQGFVANDPDAAVAYVMRHLENPMVVKAIFWVAGDLFLISPKRARDFVLHLPEELQVESLYAIGGKADALVPSKAPDATSPKYVAEWIMQFPPQTWGGGLSAALGQWKSGNARELFAWMGDLPPQARTAVARKFPSYVAAETAQQDFDLIQQATDSVLRKQLLEQMMREAAYAREAMVRVLENSSLPSEQRSYLAGLIPLSEESDSTEP